MRFDRLSNLAVLNIHKERVNKEFTERSETLMLTEKRGIKWIK